MMASSLAREPTTGLRHAQTNKQTKTKKEGLMFCKTWLVSIFPSKNRRDLTQDVTDF